MPIIAAGAACMDAYVSVTGVISKGKVIGKAMASVVGLHGRKRAMTFTRLDVSGCAGCLLARHPVGSL